MKNINSSPIKILLIALLQVLPVIAFSQNYFQQVYPTTYDKTARDILPTPDGGYLLTGYTNTTSVTDCDLYVMKTDAAGNMLWGKQYGGSKPDYSYAMCETSDGNYFITGYTASFGGGDLDVYLIKIDPSGNLLWQKTYGSWGNDEGREIIRTADDNYVIVGTMGPATGSVATQDAFLIKIDLSGTILWQKYYGGSNKEFGNSVKQCPDGGFIVAGQTFSWGQNGDTYIIRTNSTGDTLWTKMHSSPLADEAVWVTANADGSYAFAIRDSTASNDVDVRALKLDANGAVVFDKVYGSTDKDTPKSICSTSDGGYMVGAISRSFGWINPDMWLLKLDGNGDLSWTTHFGGSDHEHCYKAKEWDNGYIAVGHSKSYGSSSLKIMFVKMNANGAVGIRENTIVEKLDVYPNPTTDGKLYVSNEHPVLEVRLTNALGQTVIERSNTAATLETEIILGDQKPGVYLLNIETEKGLLSKKIVIGE